MWIIDTVLMQFQSHEQDEGIGQMERGSSGVFPQLHLICIVNLVYCCSNAALDSSYASRSGDS